MSLRRTNCTSSEQYEAYVNFLERNKEFGLGEFDTTMSQEFKDEKWDELSQILNGERGPSRTVRVWKIALNQWKKKVMQNETNLDKKIRDGGEGTSKMSTLEMRALIQWKKREAEKATENRVPVPDSTEESEVKDTLQNVPRTMVDITPEVIEKLDRIVSATETIAAAVNEYSRINMEYINVLAQSVPRRGQ